MLGGLVLLVAIVSVLYVFGTWFFQRSIDARCPKTKTVYRFQPPTFLQYAQQPPSVFKTYSDMFWNQEPWLGFVESQSSNKGPINPLIMGGLPTTIDAGTIRESGAFLNQGV